ncbi:hypothetical protein E7Z59_11975 [Robertkochia marina]|uniref:Outer membrane protein beta-barrel domain-containing protein n=1 Tax=Robertkochia marina TaxID=1227945 RepID=A0A4S3M0P2_9FLAO|nr:DUF6048 family protein [Robertkochia marina]THD66513.1 hypothetical protein E7Z59_11975 [Robertkochia marina]TRZ45648.1 hypothetical protein D3A96_06660 [Robertkochia marina]
MLRSITSILILLTTCMGFAQEAEIVSNTLSDDPVYYQKYGLRVGVDLSKPLRSALDENYEGLELVGDFRLSYKLYLAAELGTEEKTTLEDNFDFTTRGNYIKAGVEWNTYENWYGMHNIISVGLRGGFSTFSQTLNAYRIYTEDQYWNDNTEEFPGVANLGEYDGLTAQWAEVVVGLKVEMFKNLYMGATVRLNYLINDTASDVFPNLYIPGFNKVTDGSQFGVGYNYTISYLIPIFKTAAPKKNPGTSSE